MKAAFPLSCAANRHLKSLANGVYKVALRGGEIVRPDECEQCGSLERVGGHHEDYAEPLRVRWLCPECHHRRHAAIGRENKARGRRAGRLGHYHELVMPVGYGWPRYDVRRAAAELVIAEFRGKPISAWRPYTRWAHRYDKRAHFLAYYARFDPEFTRLEEEAGVPA